MSSAARDYFEGYRIQNDISGEMSAWKKTFVFLVLIVYNGVWAFARESIIYRKEERL